MSNLMACRMCLAIDTRMYKIANTPLQKIYEKMTDISLQTDDGRPTMACYICHHLLKRSDGLIQTAVRADGLLREILSRGSEINEKSISLLDKSKLHISLGVTNMDCLAVERESEIEVHVKVEKSPVKREKEKEDVAEEREADFEVPDQIPDDPPAECHSSSESEDDVPLKAFSSKKTTPPATNGAAERQHKAKIRKQNFEESKKLLENVNEIFLSKEEQLAEVQERAKSLNYLNSPYKCGLCYKGFVDSRAFQNHNEKHDERSGPFECDVCRLRYRSTRLLRAHALTSHARLFACSRCQHRARTANQAREHERWHNGHTYECQLCSHSFRKPTSYLTHMRKRHPTQHACADCGLSFVSRHGLLMHRSKAHRGIEKSVAEDRQPSFCTQCDIQFSSVEAWQQHILTSIKHAASTEDNTSSEAAVSCAACGARVPPGAVRAHVRRHRPCAPAPAPRLQLPCAQCGGTFSNRSKLQAHVRRMHLGLKYSKHMVCEVCGKNCTSNAALKYHQRTHTGEKPHACALCQKRFADKNQLRIHSRTHSGERPYCCAACGKRFSQKPALNRHYRIHTGAKPYACQFCAKTFSQSNSLKLHISAVHLKLPQNKKKAASTVDQPRDV